MCINTLAALLQHLLRVTTSSVMSLLYPISLSGMRFCAHSSGHPTWLGVAALTEWEKGPQQHANAGRTAGGTAHSSRASTPPAPDARPARVDPAAPSDDGVHHQDNQRATTPDPTAEIGPAGQQSLTGPPVAQVFAGFDKPLRSPGAWVLCPCRPKDGRGQPLPFHKLTSIAKHVTYGPARS